MKFAAVTAQEGISIDKLEVYEIIAYATSTVNSLDFTNGVEEAVKASLRPVFGELEFLFCDCSGMIVDPENSEDMTLVLTECPRVLQ